MNGASTLLLSHLQVQGGHVLSEPWGDISDQDLHAYVDGALDRARRHRIALYLAHSPVDAARVEAFRAQKEGIHELFDDVMIEPLPKRLKRALVGSAVLRSVRRCAPIMTAIGITSIVLLGGSALGQHFVMLKMHGASAAVPAPPGHRSFIIRPPPVPPAPRGQDI